MSRKFREKKCKNGREKEMEQVLKGLPKEITDRYIVGECLGKGAQGSVFAVRSTQDDTEYAMKVLEIEDVSYSKVMEAYKSAQREIENMKCLQHCPHVVRILESFEEKTERGYYIYIIMEKLMPITKLQDRDPFIFIQSPEDIVRLGMDICDAIEEFQSHGVIHRDIKPSNIYVDLNANPPMYKLGDLGSSKRMEQTARGTEVGTFGYMAPEVLTAGTYGYRVDVYSLGATLYSLANRDPIYISPLRKDYGGTKQEYIRQCQMQGKRLEPPRYLVNLKEWQRLSDVILKACEINPNNRFKDAAEFKENLAQCLPSANHKKAPKRERSAGKQIGKIVKGAVIIVLLFVGAGVASLVLGTKDGLPRSTPATTLPSPDVIEGSSDLASDTSGDSSEAEYYTGEIRSIADESSWSDNWQDDSDTDTKDDSAKSEGDSTEKETTKTGGTYSGSKKKSGIELSAETSNPSVVTLNYYNANEQNFRFGWVDECIVILTTDEGEFSTTIPYNVRETIAPLEKGSKTLTFSGATGTPRSLKVSTICVLNDRGLPEIVDKKTDEIISEEEYLKRGAEVKDGFSMTIKFSEAE